MIRDRVLSRSRCQAAATAATTVPSRCHSDYAAAAKLPPHPPPPLPSQHASTPAAAVLLPPPPCCLLPPLQQPSCPRHSGAVTLPPLPPRRRRHYPPAPNLLLPPPLRCCVTAIAAVVMLPLQPSCCCRRHHPAELAPQRLRHCRHRQVTATATMLSLLLPRCCQGHQSAIAPAMVGIYMKHINIRGHTKRLWRYTKRASKIVIGYFERVITFKMFPIFFQNWGGWDTIGQEGKRGPPHKNRVTDCENSAHSCSGFKLIE